MKAAKHYHYFAYSIQMNESEETKPSKLRDGASFSEITATLGRLGYEYGQIIFNIPSSSGREPRAEKDQFCFVKPDDLIVLTTRPPLDDRRHGDKKHMDGSSTHLEQQVFAEFRKYLAVCARSHIELTPQVGAHCTKAEMTFYQHKSARLKSFKRLDEFRHTKTPEDSDLAIGFFLRTRKIASYGCGLVACFGMRGWDTLIWNRIVRTRYPNWFSRPSFVMAQIDLRGVPSQPITLDFVEKLQVDILVEHKIED